MIPSFQLASEALMSALAARAEDWTEWTLIEVSPSTLADPENLTDLPQGPFFEGYSVALGIKIRANQPLKWVTLPTDFVSPSLAVSSVLAGRAHLDSKNIWANLRDSQRPFTVKIKNSKGFFKQQNIEFLHDPLSLLPKQ
jgi:hypothetical protein